MLAFGRIRLNTAYRYLVLRATEMMRDMGDDWKTVGEHFSSELRNACTCATLPNGDADALLLDRPDKGWADTSHDSADVADHFGQQEQRNQRLCSKGRVSFKENWTIREEPNLATDFSEPDSRYNDGDSDLLLVASDELSFEVHSSILRKVS
jgi:hypothetical protein